MSEEEMIDLAQNIAKFGWSDYDDFEINKKAIQGLLDLYNKEKENDLRQSELMINMSKRHFHDREKIRNKDKTIDLMAKEILRLDTEKSKFEYDHTKMWDTETGIKEYFTKKASE